MQPFPFQFPAQAPTEPSPKWIGEGFMIGGELHSIVEYSSDLSGWDDALTTVHEDATGADHPIDIASRDRALRALSRYLTNPNSTILEVGCSSGYLLPLIRAAFSTATVVGADVVKVPLLKLAERFPDLPLLRFDLTRCPLPDACVDAVVMLNVLEHINAQEAALEQVRRILKPGGVLVIEVPAGPHLYDYYDRHLRHYRRYARRDLVAACTQAGLISLEISHLGFWVYPAFWFVKKMNRWLQPETNEQGEELVTRQISGSGSSRLMKLAMGFETYCEKRFAVKYSFGIRCTGVFRKME
jgi:SAM-dependent methyltransferase